MSKKVKRHKNVEIRLEPDGFSVHTIELSIQLNQSVAKSLCMTSKIKPASTSSTRTNNLRDVTSARNMLTLVYASGSKRSPATKIIPSISFAWSSTHVS